MSINVNFVVSDVYEVWAISVTGEIKEKITEQRAS
jgi:hypothetical protein